MMYLNYPDISVVE